MKLPLVRLEDADDKYPPKDKELLMLEHMALIFRDKFKWFVKADDDTFIRVPKLVSQAPQTNATMLLLSLRARTHVAKLLPMLVLLSGTGVLAWTI